MGRTDIERKGDIYMCSCGCYVLLIATGEEKKGRGGGFRECACAYLYNAAAPVAIDGCIYVYNVSIYKCV